MKLEEVPISSTYDHISDLALNQGSHYGDEDSYSNSFSLGPLGLAVACTGFGMANQFLKGNTSGSMG